MKIYMETLGCPKNFNDTQVAKGILLEAGFEIAKSIEEAQVLILNTCGFINDAKKESIERIFELAQCKGAGSGDESLNNESCGSESCGSEGAKKLLVSGCLSQRYSKELLEEMPEVDGFIGVNEYKYLPDIINQLFQEKKRLERVNPCCDKLLERLPRDLSGETLYSQTLKIAEGCDNRCAYCAIPDIRGSFRSKKMEDVVEEAKWLAAKGCKELILIAQDVTLYGKDLYGKQMLPELLRKLCQVQGIQWIRLMYCYEDRITDDLIEVMKTEPKLCHYIDIPLQHVSDSVLGAMRRRSTGASIRATIQKLRKAIPDIHIRTTLITGFPGETEEDFCQLLDFVEETKFARLGAFAYSQEENTPAGEMKNQIPQEIKEQRQDAIMRRQLDISLANNKEKMGQELTVLVEERDQDGSYIGRTQYDAPEIDNSVIFTSHRELKSGDMVQVLIQDGFDYDLTGMEVQR